MGSRDLVRTAASAVALFGFGAGAAATVAHGDSATGLLLVLAALWIGSVWTLRAHRVRSARTVPAPQTALEAAQVELRVLANLLDQAPAPMLTLHADGAVRAVNRSARRLFGTEDRLAEPSTTLLEAIGGGEARRLTVDLGAAERRKTYVLSATDFVGPRGVRRLVVLLDIEPELQAAEASALRELMGVLNHEIMNGLTPIASLAASAAELLAEPLADGAAARQAVLTIARRSEGLGRFIAAYRALAQLPPPARRPSGLGAVLEETAALFRARWPAGRVALDLVTPDPEVICDIDEELVVRALTNLLVNAAEAALAAGGPDPRVALSGRAEDGGVVVSVRDNGAGVRAADRDRIFQPFHTTKPDGAGVGLSLSRQIARSHGGELRLLAPGPPGATFELRLQ